ncbi:MAG: DUF1223 domain-containing protein [Burkholderiaceae bacterium]
MPSRSTPHSLLAANAAALFATLIATPTWAASTCQAQSGATPPTVVELYTSEGCSSCPPADRWLSSLNNQPDVLPLAFHVNYWDRLGWQDRFATRATTERQHRVREVLKGRYVYTPQVVLNGRDERQWSGYAAGRLAQVAGATPSAPPTLTLQRTGHEVTATVGTAQGQPALAGYWAVVQDGLSSRVTRGENAGETLQHDHVVSLYQPVASWAADQPKTVQLNLPQGPEFDALRVAFVVTLPDLVHPVQALSLHCPG